jgi:hypothetical protein
VATGTISVPTGLTVTANRYAVGGSAAIGLDTGYVIPLQSTLDAKALGATTITVAGTANQITSSAGAQDLSANRTWTLSIPSQFNIQQASTTLLSANTGYFNWIEATSTTATSTIINALQVGNSITARDNMVNFDCDSRVYPASATVGGCIHINNGTVNTGPALELVTGVVSSAAPLAQLNVTNASFAHSGMTITYSGAGDGLTITGASTASNAASLSNAGVDHTFNASYTGSTAQKGAMNLTSTNTGGSVFQITGNSVGLGIGKITHNDTGDADSSLLSLDASNAGYLGQGIFLDMNTVGGTQKILNLRADSSEKLTLTAGGLLTFGYSSSTIYSSFITASTTNLRIGLADGCLNVTSGLVGSTGSPCGAGSGGADFTYNTDIGYGITGSATTTKTQFTLGIHASSTSHFANATSTLFTAVTGWFTNIFVGVDTLAEYISDTAGAFFTGNTETGITVTYQDADNTVDVVCNTADTNTFGCLTDTDWDTFNNKAGLTANTFTGLQTFAYSSSTIYSSFITASSTFARIGTLTLDQDLTVANGGTGASTLTGLLQGNGSSAFTAITDSSTVGQILRVTGASTYGWGALNLDDTDAFTGTLPASAIEDSYLLNNGDVGTGVYDFGGTTSFEITNGTAPVFSAIGQIGLDTTDKQLIVATSTGASDIGVIPLIQTIYSRTVASTSVDFLSGGRISLPYRRDGFTITEIHCFVDGGTSKAINLDTMAGGANTDSVTCATTATSDTAMSANYNIAAGTLMALEFGATTGSVDYVNVTVYGFYTRE